MYEMVDVNPDSMAAELAYRRSVLMGTRSVRQEPRGRWRRRRAPRTD
jgi:hypothetical protein